MKIGDLVTFCPEEWGTPLADRPLGVVIREAHFISEGVGHLIDIKFPGDPDVYSLKPQTLELVNENW